MRKVFVSLVALAAFAAGSAFAQSGYYAGASTGYPFGITLHFGMEDLIAPGADLRFNLDADFSSGSIQGTNYSIFSVALGADLLYGFAGPAETPELTPYVGGGLTAGIASGSAGNIGLGGAVFDVHGIGGAEYAINENWGVYGEAQLGYGSVAGAAVANGVVVSQAKTGLTFALSLGVNYHF